MWLNHTQITDAAISTYRTSLLTSAPNHIVIDNLFNNGPLDNVLSALQQTNSWQTQKHTYSALYVDNQQWENTHNDERFVQRDVWQRENNIAQAFLSYLRSEEFMAFLSRIFKITITDINVAEPSINTNFFRLSAHDFVEQHADDSPGREICMLLYLNKHWDKNAGGELVFIGQQDQPISIAPLYNRCVLFDPASEGSEHWVNKLNAEHADQYRYNITSWYWSE